MSQFARFACWSEGKYATTIKAIALATKKGSTAMSVEYVATASDGRGRLYARQIGAQSLPRNLRLLMYGSTHKEVDMSGAHCSLEELQLLYQRKFQEELQTIEKRFRFQLHLLELRQLEA